MTTILKTTEYQTFEYGVTPTSGTRLWALTHCVFEINRMFSTNTWIPVENVSNFYETKRIVNHHEGQGLIEYKKDSKSFIRLTVSGKNYFLGRINGMNPRQKLDKKTIDDTMAMIMGKPQKNKTRTITILQL